MESETRVSPSPPLAHIQRTGHGRFRLHRLDEHLRSVERLAGGFADKFGAEDWGRIAGLWHDLGKFQPAFQSYIRRESGFDPEAHLEDSVPGRVDHSSAGALHAVAHLGKKGDRTALPSGSCSPMSSRAITRGSPTGDQADGGAGVPGGEVAGASRAPPRRPPRFRRPFLFSRPRHRRGQAALPRRLSPSGSASSSRLSLTPTTSTPRRSWTLSGRGRGPDGRTSRRSPRPSSASW